MRVLTLWLLCSAGSWAADTFLLRSVDAGATWTPIDPDSPDRFLRSLRIDSRGPTLYLLTQRDLGGDWRLSASLDGGQTWRIRQSFPPSAWNVLAATSAGPDSLYLAYEVFGVPQKSVMIARVTGGGDSMEQYRAEGLAIDPPRAGLQSTYAALVDFAVVPSAPSSLFALVTNEYADDVFAFFQALWTSVDGGRNWRRLTLPLADCGYPEVQLDPAGSSVYLACGNELVKSTDGGLSWTPKSFPGGIRLWNLQFGPGDPAVLFGGRQGEIWRSLDGAETWQRLGVLPLASQARFLTPHPLNPSLLFTATTDGVAKSEDGGETWMLVTRYAMLSESPFRLLIDPRAPDTFYLVNWQRQPLRLMP